MDLVYWYLPMSRDLWQGLSNTYLYMYIINNGMIPNDESKNDILLEKRYIELS